MSAEPDRASERIDPHPRGRMARRAAAPLVVFACSAGLGAGAALADNRGDAFTQMYNDGAGSCWDRQTQLRHPSNDWHYDVDLNAGVRMRKPFCATGDSMLAESAKARADLLKGSSLCAGFNWVTMQNAATAWSVGNHYNLCGSPAYYYVNGDHGFKDWAGTWRYYYDQTWSSHLF
jgi:hypothetical protein